MPKELPKPPPDVVAKMDQLYAAASQMLDRYVHGFEMDMNRHAVKHGAMSDEVAHWHMTQILRKTLPADMTHALAAAAIVRGIAKKREGKG